jgi:predicted metal-dependent phosphoesterase TrpH
MSYKVDFHVHTNRSPDGRSSLNALAAAAKKRGLDAIAVADHDLFSIPAPVTIGGLLVLPACECSTQQGHILGLLPEQAPDCAVREEAGALPSAADTAKELRRCGAVIVLAHPYARPSVDFDALGFRPDAVETANARALFKSPDANRLAAEYAAAERLPALGGSDAHSRSEVGNAYTVVDCENLNPDDLREALLSGRCSPVFVRNSSPLSKGLSQFCMARRLKDKRRICRSAVYLFYCLLRSIFSKR